MLRNDFMQILEPNERGDAVLIVRIKTELTASKFGVASKYKTVIIAQKAQCLQRDDKQIDQKAKVKTSLSRKFSQQRGVAQWVE